MARFSYTHTHPVRGPAAATSDTKFVGPRAAKSTRESAKARDCSGVLAVGVVAHYRCGAMATTARLRRATTLVTPSSTSSSLRRIIVIFRRGRGECFFATAPGGATGVREARRRRAYVTVHFRATLLDGSRITSAKKGSHSNCSPLRACHDVMCVQVSRACHASHASLATTFDAVCRSPPEG